MLPRRWRAWTASIRAGVWQPREGVQILGKTLGMIGLGGIGAEVARIAQGIGMQVIAWNRTPRAEAAVPLVDLDTLLQRADVVSLNLVLNDETRGFLDAAAHRAHEARGDPGQHRARRAGRRGGTDRRAATAGISAMPGSTCSTPSRCKSDHPLARMDNVTLSAHAAFRTLEASMTLLRRAIDIVKTGCVVQA